MRILNKIHFMRWTLTALFLATSTSLLTEPSNKGDLVLHSTLQEVNRNVFSSYHIQLSYLKDCPQAIPTLADWLYETWHPYDASLTKEKLIASFKTRLNTDKVPITFVALKDSHPVGVISLKKQTSPELSDFPDTTLWIGGLQVAPEERNQGIGHELLKFAKSVAKYFGYEKLHFYTSDPNKVNWYIKNGAQILEKRPFRNHTITIMYLELS